MKEATLSDKYFCLLRHRIDKVLLNMPLWAYNKLNKGPLRNIFGFINLFVI
jgi:hypothetical protein